MTEVLTAILVIITGFYAWVTFKILEANRRSVLAMQEQLEAIFRPYVTIRLNTEMGSSHLNLRIANTGKTPARKVRLALDRDFYMYGIKQEKNKLNNFAAFNSMIEGISPGEEFDIPLAIGLNIFSDKADHSLTPLVFSINASYSYGARSVTEDTVIDFRPYADALEKRDPIVQELQQLNLHVFQLLQRGS